MESGRLRLEDVLADAEAAAPVESLDVVARNLRERFAAQYASFLFVDVVGRKVVRVSEKAETQQGRRADQIPLVGSVYEQALRTQDLVLAPDGGAGQRVVAPVTNRGDTIGVLELFLPDPTPEALAQVKEAAHALAYILVADRRFTDLYHWGQRTTPVSLAAEIQHQLLPSAPSCEAPEFTLAATLVPAQSVGGDTYDYTLDRETLHLSITDAMGHDVDSALMATLLVNASRGARRA
ncbi:PP2C family protein-serine/threonine phosphatase [Streptomyces albidoflavus]|uniref:PP2C family protein-serine/threonine phosphatase n=1 Tax=Streptomyces albidoflavus TaxID=1886 RepID=UPI0034178F21